MFRAPEDLVWTEDKLQEHVEADDIGLFVAEFNGKVAGVIMLEMSVRQNKRFVFVNHIAVKEMYQRKGIGRSLMETTERWAKERGGIYILLNVWDFNEGAISFYEKLGYDTTWRAMSKSLPPKG